MELTGFNLFAKADLFRRFRMQRKFANFKSTLTRMIRTDKYTFTTDFIMDGRGLSEHRCEALWTMLIMPAITDDTDITKVLFPGFNSSFNISRYTPTSHAMT
ncbi:hypothetical protein CYMTET_37624 [Cymbomonas tetramitiformis]|uniref:Uncharacterized protein n=1 Tax=Cymbomonas tetramitiformis TaxID=36881 RepID=A0AAE0CFY3_9CHLO|nr:hypothetical protein CYMTET_37624 [Cymbomonas tetramitiformis]